MTDDPSNHDESLKKPALTNDDFRKLVGSGTVRSSHVPPNGPTVIAPPTTTPAQSSKKAAGQDATKSGVPKKKRRQQQINRFKKEKEEKEEMLARYRDRAKERRDGFNKDYDDVDLLQVAGEYRAAAPDIAHQDEMRERRRKLIAESKYLGGDMAHTHLVKGLDFALLEKVRGEMTGKHHRDDDEDDEEPPQRQQRQSSTLPELPPQAIEDTDSNKIKSVMALNIISIMFGSANAEQQRVAATREHFKRMAYVVDFDEDTAAAAVAGPEPDVPTTVHRSAAEAGRNGVGQSTDSINSSEAFADKLIEILTALRSGKTTSAVKPPVQSVPASKPAAPAAIGASIYDDVGDYVPPSKSSGPPQGIRLRDKESSAGSYFGSKPALVEQEGIARSVGDSSKTLKPQLLQRWRDVAANDDGEAGDVGGKGDTRLMAKLQQKLDSDAYMECYPGMGGGMFSRAMGEDDSGDEDKPGKKKARPATVGDASKPGPSSSGLVSKPTKPGGKQEKAALEREWKQIQQIMESRREKKSS